jgi:DNA modification methylase/transcriptional regulator with XRE-family HTH domain/DNA-directed RNA polymerase subunit RPC12/RpoP
VQSASNTWSAHDAIRSRREQLGLSQAFVAQQLGVTKSLLSLVEAGKRQPSEEQITLLSSLLNLPPDLLMLGAGRLPEDIRSVFEDNAAAGVAAIRQRIEQHPTTYPKMPRSVPVPRSGGTRKSDLGERIEVSKTSVYQRAHSYHTKVPPDAIVPFIKAFTRPGDTVYDPFCGSGMTGIAALLADRNALLSDVSIAAVHIARNYTRPCDPSAFSKALKIVERHMEPIVSWLYKPLRASTLVEYTTWSDVYRCPSCRSEIIYWESVQRNGSVDGDRVGCSACSKRFRKADLQWIGEKPVLTQSSSGSSRIDSHLPTLEELALIEESEKAPIPYWAPVVPFGNDREMWRASHRSMGVTGVAEFFTKRNLHVLAALRHSILQAGDERVREALLFAFTACVNRASKRYQWNPKRPTNVMTGTLYISSLRYEWNVWSLFRRKAADVLRFYEQFPRTKAVADVFQRSATDLDCIPDESIDMVFMDPPFGSNIFYADSSLLWESWLGALTDESLEIVVNKHRASSAGGKDLAQYGSLMSDSFSHSARILKPGGRAVLAFSNSDDAVWTSIQEALANAGLETETVHILDKGQPSIKGVKGLNGKENVTCLDLVLCLKRKGKAVQMPVPFPPPATFIDDSIRSALRDARLRTDEVYSAVLRDVMAAQYSVSGITMPIIAERCRAANMAEADGFWTYPEIAKAKGTADNVFLDGYLSSPDALPVSKSDETCDESIRSIRVEGGRNSAFYTAHSYHTKVPPEAILPFIEHYSKPGDVVLDPFCGSGMTGVAAALSGRRAILNDLSPAAVHLAWNHTHPCDPAALMEGFALLERRLSRFFEELYRTEHSDGTPGLIHWILWSTEHKCPSCRKHFALWDAIDHKTGRVGTTISCPLCSAEITRKDLKSIDSRPAWIAYELPDGKRHEKAASTKDIQRARKFKRTDIVAWTPDVPLGPDREMYIRCALKLKGVSSVADLYTPRNLHALAVLWREIGLIEDERIKRALAFAFTNTAWHGSRMRRFNARGGQRPLTGTLYIPQLSSEANVFEVMRNKMAQLHRFYRSFRPRIAEAPSVILGSATNLSKVRDGSIDYVFTDPPFGSNIFYADCNLIWESWLGKLTDISEEAVVNRSLSVENGGKSLEQYGSLISAALAEISRVLKPGGWATIVFHNTDASVWQAIKDAALTNGFEFHEASSLDRKQQSHKGYKGRGGEEDVAHFDVIFNLRKATIAKRKPLSKIKRNRPEALRRLRDVIASILREEPASERGLQGVHAEVMRRLASHGDSEFVDYADVRKIWESLPKGELALSR